MYVFALKIAGAANAITNYECRATNSVGKSDWIEIQVKSDGPANTGIHVHIMMLLCVMVMPAQGYIYTYYVCY